MLTFESNKKKKIPKLKNAYNSLNILCYIKAKCNDNNNIIHIISALVNEGSYNILNK